MTSRIDGDRPIVLTGFMGTGKSTTGRLVADRLGYRFVDTDTLIEERHGPIVDIFDARGEAAFRSLEAEVATELSRHPRMVIATGGRLMLDPANIATLGRSGLTCCLNASASTIVERVLGDTTGPPRPLLGGDSPRTAVLDLLAERGASYRRFAQLDTEGRSPGEVADSVCSLSRFSPLAVSSGTNTAIIGVSMLGSLQRGLARPLVAVAEHGDPDADLFGPFLADTVMGPDDELPEGAHVASLGDPALAQRLADRVGPSNVIHCPLHLGQIIALSEAPAARTVIEVAALQAGGANPVADLGLLADEALSKLDV